MCTSCTLVSYICWWQEIPCLTSATLCFPRAHSAARMSVATCIYVSHINVCSSSHCLSRHFCLQSCCRSGKCHGLGLSHFAWCYDSVQNFDVCWSAYQLYSCAFTCVCVLIYSLIFFIWEPVLAWLTVDFHLRNPMIACLLFTINPSWMSSERDVH